MPLLVLMYHRARAGRHGNLAFVLDRHLDFVAQRFGSVLPGEPLRRDALNVCLTFDDAYFDFYAIVVPLLEKHKLQALLAVPTAAIVEHTAAERARRLDISSEEAFASPASGGFCTWPELGEIARTGRVAFAAHGHTHSRLDQPGVDLEQEVDRPREILEQRLGAKVTSFVYPYGRFDRRSHGHVSERYSHAFRIGGAINRGWNSPVLYRVTADELESADAPFRFGKLATYRIRHAWNRLRRR